MLRIIVQTLDERFVIHLSGTLHNEWYDKSFPIMAFFHIVIRLPWESCSCDTCEKASCTKIGSNSMLIFTFQCNLIHLSRRGPQFKKNAFYAK